ncbi:MAG: hypothetical protein M1827_001686 [Pycnora praestabilis]|nr:MAG: hypothetical protein M1827_001686 [Pycnora praestabilis]
MSSPSFKFITIDVFTKTRYTGNPLAIVTIPQGHQPSLSQERKQIIAKEFNLSETVFLHEASRQDEKNSWTISIFTTDAELPWAGHPTIGSACHVLSCLSNSSTTGSEENVLGTLLTKAGPIPITYHPTTQTASATIPFNLHVHTSLVPLSHVNACNMQHPGLGSHQLQYLYPIVSIVKGVSFVLIDLPDVAALGCISAAATAARSVEKVNGKLDEGWRDGFVGFYYYVRCGNNGKVGEAVQHLRTRMLEPSIANGEDAATGSAASALAAYLTLEEAKPGETRIYAIVQGVEMGRRSEIGVEVTLKEGEDRGVEKVVLSGSAVGVTEGTIII